MDEGKTKEIIRWVIALGIGAGILYIGWNVRLVLIAFHVLLCITLIIVVLLQSGKAADLAGAFGGAGSQTAFGPRGAATFLSKATTWCAIMFMLASLVISLRQDTTGTPGGTSLLERTQQSAPAPKSETPAPVTPPPATPQQQTPPPAKQP